VLTWTMPLLVAPFIGSFLGVLIHRLPRHLPVVLARSGCDACGTRLEPLDLVPLVSYALQRGRCRYCQDPIGWFHPIIELAALCVAIWAVLACDTPQEMWIACLLGWMLLALGWIDVEWFLLPDVLTLPLLVVGLGVTILTVPDDMFWHALGAVSGYLGLRGIALLYRAVRGREGLGAGDAKLMAAAGSWLGLGALPLVLLLAALAGLAFAGIATATGRMMQATTALPFGTFLAASIWLVWLYGPMLRPP
jgi:leader peptidase (prepilin peptidase) / N-methyltransferase